MATQAPSLSSIISAIKKQDLGSQASEDLELACIALVRIHEISDGIWISASELEQILRDACGHHIPRQRLAPLLSKNSKLFLRKNSKGKRRFKASQACITRVANKSSMPLLVNPANAFSGRRDVQTLFSAVKGEVRICDPYTDPSTFDFVNKIPTASPVRLLTMQTRNEGEMKRDISALSAQGLRLEVRKVGQKVIHDRYLIDDDGVLVLGTSLNGLGKKQSIIVQLSGDIRDLLSREFDFMWNSATPL